MKENQMEFNEEEISNLGSAIFEVIYIWVRVRFIIPYGYVHFKPVENAETDCKLELYWDYA